MYTSWIFSKKPDLSMGLNGILAGLVGITAGADLMGLHSALLIGVIAGVLVYFAVVFFDRIRVDDPVGTISVHLVCGIWGTLAVGFFGSKAGLGQLIIQIIGIVSYDVACAVAAFVFFGIIKAVMGLRVSEEEEVEGLDQGEHGMPAYGEFVSTSSVR